MPSFQRICTGRSEAVIDPAGAPKAKSRLKETVLGGDRRMLHPSTTRIGSPSCLQGSRALGLEPRRQVCGSEKTQHQLERFSPGTILSCLPGSGQSAT